MFSGIFMLSAGLTTEGLGACCCCCCCCCCTAATAAAAAAAELIVMFWGGGAAWREGSLAAWDWWSFAAADWVAAMRSDCCLRRARTSSVRLPRTTEDMFATRWAVKGMAVRSCCSILAGSWIFWANWTACGVVPNWIWAAGWVGRWWDEASCVWGWCCCCCLCWSCCCCCCWCWMAVCCNNSNCWGVIPPLVNGSNSLPTVEGHNKIWLNSLIKVYKHNVFLSPLF